MRRGGAYRPGRNTGSIAIDPPARASCVLALAASAGGVDALTSVVAGLPPGLPAAVLVVLHIAPVGPSVLPGMISRHSRLPAAHPDDGDPLLPGRVYVAPPDRHLVVSDGAVRVLLTPKENGTRPAADPLFRSVAHDFGPSAAGVVLSGSLDDGTAGLAAIKDAGGLTVVQDPEEAAFPGMPLSAISYVKPDHIATLDEIPSILVGFVEEVSAVSHADEPESVRGGAEPGDELFEFTCPECGGTLWLVGDHPVRFRCRVGHTFSSDSLAVGKQDAVESALYAAVVALEERADLARRLLRRLAPSRGDRLRRRYEGQIEQAERGAATLRRMAGDMIAAADVEEDRGAEGRAGPG
ncbi:MAG: chemotaxis protein CheB [Acidobacteriota bacterium]|nr:chemotaxis protein CheB [Acidobacteriota bacterium]